MNMVPVAPDPAPPSPPQGAPADPSAGEGAGELSFPEALSRADEARPEDPGESRSQDAEDSQDGQASAVGEVPLADLLAGETPVPPDPGAGTEEPEGERQPDGAPAPPEVPAREEAPASHPIGGADASVAGALAGAPGEAPAPGVGAGEAPHDGAGDPRDATSAPGGQLAGDPRHLATLPRARAAGARPGGSETGAAGPADPSSSEVRAPEQESLPGSEEREESESGARERESRPAPARAAPREPFADPLARALQGTTSNGTPRPGESRAGGDSGRTLPEIPVQNESRILSHVRVLIQDNGGVARIHLEPPQLGGLSLRVTVTHDTVHLSMVADRTAVADALGRHLPELRHALASQGLQLDHAEVDVRDHGDPGRPRPEGSLPDGRRTAGGPRQGNAPRARITSLGQAAAAIPLVTDHLSAVNLHV